MCGTARYCCCIFGCKHEHLSASSAGHCCCCTHGIYILVYRVLLLLLKYSVVHKIFNFVLLFRFIYFSTAAVFSHVYNNNSEYLVLRLYHYTKYLFV